MKKKILYIVLGLVAVAVAIMLLTGKAEERKRIPDQRVTLNKKDKNPYGAYLAYEELKYLFREASISASKKEPGEWDSLSNYGKNQALLIISPRFYASEYEMKKLIRFAENGNDVFVSARFLSSEVHDLIGAVSSGINISLQTDENGNNIADKPSFRLLQPPFTEKRSFSYKGLHFHSWFYDMDTTMADKLGTDEMKRTNFIHLKTGQGTLYFHLAPLTFSNYFLLHGDNFAYYENVLSVIPPGTRKLVWDEYFIEKKEYYPDNDDQKDEGSNSLSELFKYKQTKWALLIAIFTLLLYVLLEMRRRQRFIPVIAPPRNDSLDFVKTIGRLYYDRGDHHNLCHKMAAYFLEHVRNKYKIPTGNLDEEFVQKLQFKTGGDEAEIRSIVTFINQLNRTSSVTAKQVTGFYKQLESFYQKA